MRRDQWGPPDTSDLLPENPETDPTMIPVYEALEALTGIKRDDPEASYKLGRRAYRRSNPLDPTRDRDFALYPKDSQNTDRWVAGWVAQAHETVYDWESLMSSVECAWLWGVSDNRAKKHIRTIAIKYGPSVCKKLGGTWIIRLGHAERYKPGAIGRPPKGDTQTP